jgi:hypothetical protein
MCIRKHYCHTSTSLQQKWLLYILRREPSARGKQVTCQRLCLKPFEKHRWLLPPFSMVLEAKETDAGPDTARMLENDVDWINVCGIVGLSQSEWRVWARSSVQRSCVVKQCDKKRVVSPVLTAARWAQEDGAVVSGEIVVNENNCPKVITENNSSKSR